MAPFNPPVKALFFDVFGTCVDWRKSVTDELHQWAKDAAKSDSSSIDKTARSKASQMTREQWGDIAQAWRNTYLVFTRKLADDPSVPYKTVDEHHLDALRDLLAEHGLSSLYTEAQLKDLSFVWHRLAPWPDTIAGLHALNAQHLATCTLSNGNLALLHDMVRNAGMPFTHVYSAEMFQSYKPSPKVYLGAAEKQGLRAEECAMVAAHLDDLKWARKFGLRTVYVWRAQEEKYPELEEEGRNGFVDVWVEEGQGGFEEVARRLAG